MKTKEVKFEFPLTNAASFQFEADSAPLLRFLMQGFREAEGPTGEVAKMLKDMLNNCKARMNFSIFITEESLDFKESKPHGDIFDI